MEQVVQGCGTVDVGDKVFEGGAVLVALDDVLQCLMTLLVVILIELEHGALGTRRIDGRGADQSGQNASVDNHLVEEGAKVGNFRLAGDLEKGKRKGQSLKMKSCQGILFKLSK